MGLEPGASLEEVNQAYKDLVFIWHPDRVPQENERLVKKSVEKIQQINEARDSLRSYHRKYKQAPATKSTSYSNSSSQRDRYSSKAQSTSYSNGSYSDRYSSNRSQEQSVNSSSGQSAYRDRYSSYRSPYSDTGNRQTAYSRPNYDRTSYQDRDWNYRDYYSTPRNPQQTSKNRWL